MACGRRSRGGGSLLPVKTPRDIASLAGTFDVMTGHIAPLRA
jgi:hypothetical protein